MTYRRLLPALALALLTACNSDSTLTAFDVLHTAKLDVVVTADTVVAIREVWPASENVRLRFPVSITNRGREVMRANECAGFIETKRGGNWSFAGGIICALSGPHDMSVAPGETKEFVVDIYDVTGPNPQFSGALPGEFRYRLGFITPGFSGRMPTAVSNTFVAVMPD